MSVYTRIKNVCVCVCEYKYILYYCTYIAHVSAPCTYIMYYLYILYMYISSVSTRVLHFRGRKKKVKGKI